MTGSAIREIVVIGGSAGGVEALVRLVPLLPPGSPIAYVVVVHVGEQAQRSLDTVLAAKAALPVAYASDGDVLRGGTLTVAPPGAHTTVTRTAVRLVSGPRENGHRPAVDVLFRSAAAAYGPRATGVILSGSLDDGAAGLAAIKAAGGRAYVQDPDEALFPSMPLNALGRSPVDGVLPIEGIGRVLAERAVETIGRKDRGTEPTAMNATRDDDEIDAAGDAEGLDRIGVKTALTCPGCGGAMWEVESDGVPVLRCHIGHAYGLDSFGFEQSLAIESALWAAVRALNEKQMLLSRLGERARAEGRERSAASFLGRAEEFGRQADGLRELVESVMTVEGVASGGAVPA